MTEPRDPDPRPDTGENPGVVPETELSDPEDDSAPVEPTTEDQP